MVTMVFTGRITGGNEENEMSIAGEGDTRLTLVACATRNWISVDGVPFQASGY